MKRLLVLFISFSSFVLLCAFPDRKDTFDLRVLYSKPVTEWPKPTIDLEANWKEFEVLDADPDQYKKLAQPKENLGKLLFFDPLLSGSNQISCSSCHDPELYWTDKRAVALGNDHLQGKRNTISLLNVAERKSWFWDGRAETLEAQAKSPIEAHHEMAMQPKVLPHKFKKIKAYRELFQKAFGDDEVNYDRITESLAAFQRTIKSRTSKFDRFLKGEYQSLNDQELQGLHLFRTKARCMNCHNGKYFSDESFHNIGLTYYKRKYEDLGRYQITGKSEDVGKFRTASLRDVMNTGPWMHNGLFTEMSQILAVYNSGMHLLDPTPEQKAADPLFPQTDTLLKPLGMSKSEMQAIEAFLGTLSANQPRMLRPDLPR